MAYLKFVAHRRLTGGALVALAAVVAAPEPVSAQLSLPSEERAGRIGLTTEIERRPAYINPPTVLDRTSVRTSPAPEVVAATGSLDSTATSVVGESTAGETSGTAGVGATVTAVTAGTGDVGATSVVQSLDALSAVIGGKETAAVTVSLAGLSSVVAVDDTIVRATASIAPTLSAVTAGTLPNIGRTISAAVVGATGGIRSATGGIAGTLSRVAGAGATAGVGAGAGAVTGR